VRHRYALIALACLLSTLNCYSSDSPESAATAPVPTLESEDDKTLYTLGLALSRQLKNFELTQSELTLIQQGLADGVLGREAKVPLEAYGPKIDAYLKTRMSAVAERKKEAGASFRDKIATEPGAVKTDSGLIYFEQQAGTGAAPTATSTVKVHYRGTLTDGTEFDRSKPDSPASFSLSGVVPCFSEGIQKMRVGGKSKLVCPPELAYGDRGAPPAIAPGATLVFEIELLEATGGSEAAPPAP
jgi:FKBP-type peptidyl-prolyl cis-trans isomerase